MSPDHRRRVRLSEAFAARDLWTMSGGDRRVSIRTTSATSPTRARGTADDAREEA